MSKSRILVVEDEAILAMDIERRLELLGYQVAGTTSSGEQAITLAAKHRPDLVLMDIRLQGAMDGIVAAEQIRQKCHLPVVFLTAYSEDATLQRAKAAEPFGYILKPFEDRELHTIIEMALYKHRAEEEIRRLNRLFMVLSQVNQAIVFSNSKPELLAKVCQIVVDHGEFKSAWISWLDPAAHVLKPVAHWGDDCGGISQMAISLGNAPANRSLLESSIHEGKTFVCNDLANDPSIIPLPKSAAELNVRAFAATPIRFQGKVCGALCFCTAEPDFFQDKETRLLDEVGMDLSYAVDNLHRDEQRSQAEQALREIQERYQALFKSSIDGVYLHDLKGQFLDANPAALNMFGYTKEDFSTLSFSDLLFTPDQPSQTPAAIAALLDRGTRNELAEYQLKRKDGACIWAEIGSTLVYHNGKPFAIQGIVHDISERKRAEAERERLISAIEQAVEMFVITDDQGAIQYVNPAFEVVTGYTRSEVIGRNPRILKSGVHEAAFYKNLWATLLRGETWWGRFTNRKKDGTLYSEETTIYPVRNASGRTVSYVAAKRDITEQLALEAQLLQAQKMESVGRLAGGVAHDFNNMLQAILGNAALALQDLAPDNPLRENLLEIQKSAQRSADLTRQLLAFARKQTIAPKVLDLNDVVAGMLKMLRRLIGENIDLAWMPGANLWPVKLDPSQVDQILANLCVNARDALGDTGKVILETANTHLDSAYAQTHSEAVPGDYVMLAVSDTGQGMDAATRAHLFEPFFTTKEPGQGTGLGLATVFGIVKQNQGLIDVDSEPGEGTSFKIYLPRSQAEILAAAETASHAPRGTETVLLVEDEEQVLSLGRRILEQQGYRVLTARTPESALEMAGQHSGEIHLLVTDVVMPGMNGRELKRQLTQRHPHLKCLFMSGYTADVIAHHGVLHDGVQFLQKPFTIESLAKKAREAIEHPNPS